MAGPTIVARHDLDPREVEERLYQFNQRATGYYDGQDLAFVAEAAGELIAAAVGYTWGGICEIRQLWVHEDHRRVGLGSALLRAAIAEARTRGCELMFIATHSFQAPGFYARHGFETIAVIPDRPLGHAEHVLRLRLT